MNFQDAVGATVMLGFLGTILRYVIKADTSGIVNGKLEAPNKKIQEHGDSLIRMDDRLTFLDKRVIKLEK